MMPPRYRDIRAADIPEVTLDSGAKVKIVCGQMNAVQGPVRDIVIEPELLDVAVPAGSTFTHKVKPGHTVFTYVLSGKGFFGKRRDDTRGRQSGELFDAESAVLYEPDGDQVVVTASEKSLRFLLLAGRPLKEPVAWQGPIVMNTQEELRTAFEESLKGHSSKSTNLRGFHVSQTLPYHSPCLFRH
jgi:redox-sensitive bicupin YhaK (pirin superfamily)